MKTVFQSLLDTKNTIEDNSTIQQANNYSYDTSTEHFDDIALVLQGGGALGSYQAGAFEALEQNRISPTWIVGISIGALNTAIIAGNPPEKRASQLKAFWDTICSAPTFHSNNLFFNWTTVFNRKVINDLESQKTMLQGQKGFFVPKFMAMMPLNKYNKSTPDKLSYYDTSHLKETLLKFADFDLINSGATRISLGVVNVGSGEFSYFDSTKDILRPEHFMASGALPPAFPAVEIDGQFYWDGGIVNNTPVTEIIEQNKNKKTLIFQIDLWNPKGSLPQTFDDITERTKDIQFSSRTTNVNQIIQHNQENTEMIEKLLAHIPPHIRKNNPWCQKAEKMTHNTDLKIIHLIYKNKDYEGATKDYEFSHLTMKEHWNSGLEDMSLQLNSLTYLPTQIQNPVPYFTPVNTINAKIEEIRKAAISLHKISKIEHKHK